MRKTVIGPDVGRDLDLFDGVEGVDGLPHSEAVAVDLPAYRRVFISGTGAIDDEGAVVAPGDAAEQFQFILERMAAILATVDGDLEDVVRYRVVTEPLDEEEYLAVTRVRSAYIAEGHEPASTMIESPSVGIDGMRLEVDAEAIIPRDGWTLENTER